MPPGIQRLTRTPEEMARDTTALKARFASALGARFQAQKPEPPLGDTIVELVVHDGEAWLVMAGNEFRIAVEAEEDGIYPLDGIPPDVTIEVGANGLATALVLVGRGGRLPLTRLDD